MRNWLRQLTPIGPFLTSPQTGSGRTNIGDYRLKRSTRSIYARKPPEFGIQAKGEVDPDTPCASGGAGG
jgi:hypothetical protein